MNLYSELLTASSEDIYLDEYYSISVKYHELELILKLLQINGHYELYEKIKNFIDDEYPVKFEHLN